MSLFHVCDGSRAAAFVRGDSPPRRLSAGHPRGTARTAARRKSHARSSRTSRQSLKGLSDAGGTSSPPDLPAQRVLRRVRIQLQARWIAGSASAVAFGTTCSTARRGWCWRREATFRRYQMAARRFFVAALAGERLELGVEGIYRQHPQEDFYGLGTRLARGRCVSASCSRDARSRDGRSLTPQAQTAARHAVRDLCIRASGRDAIDRFPSIEERFDDDRGSGSAGAAGLYLYGEAFAEFDYRDEPGQRQRGRLLHGCRGGSTPTAIWTATAFGRFDAHAAALLSDLRQEARVRGAGRLVATASRRGQHVPFFMQPTLGGGHSLRSVSDYRFRDTQPLDSTSSIGGKHFRRSTWRSSPTSGKVAPRACDLDFGDSKTRLRHRFPLQHGSSRSSSRIDIATGGGEGRETSSSSARLLTSNLHTSAVSAALSLAGWRCAAGCCRPARAARAQVLSRRPDLARPRNARTPRACRRSRSAVSSTSSRTRSSKRATSTLITRARERQHH